MSTWIDFKELRSKLDFEAVLRHFNVEVKKKGAQHHGFCPLPNHNGKRNSPSFSANLERGIFQCFGCGAKGNVLEFAALMTNVSPEDGTALRKVALELQQKFCPMLDKPSKPEPKPPEKKAEPKPNVPVVINTPLDFELKNLDPEHPYLFGRNFNRQTIERFGLGFCSRGMLKDRIAIPLHDADGKLIGYAGRVVDDSTITEDNPRYRFPGERERDGKLYQFRKTLFLYNAHRLHGPFENLAVVESFTAVWWLTQHHIGHVVSTMGADCSEEQSELILSMVKPNGRVWVISDGDIAGERFGKSVLEKVSSHHFVRWMRLGEGQQPTGMSAEQLDTLHQCFTW